MSGDGLRWGILSTARIIRAVLPAFATSERNELVAVASRDGERARAYADRHGIPVAYGSYDELLADPDIDAIYNPLPNHLHVPLTIAAAAAGKHVLCEKPLALTVDEVDQIAAAASASGVVVTEAFMYRHHPQTLRVQELVAEGAIGEPLTARGSFSFTLDNPGDVRLDPTMGGGALWDIGCYPLSFARTALGEQPIEATGWWRLGETGIDLAFWGAVRFPSGAVGQFDCTFSAPFRSHMEIVGTEGVIVIPHPFKPEADETFYLGRDTERLEPVRVTGGHLYAGEVEDLADAVLLGSAPRVTLADSRANTAAIVALLASADAGGRPLPIEA